MKYIVSYECRTEEKQFISEFEIESDPLPLATDSRITENALRDSLKFHKVGAAAISIKTIRSAT